MIKNIYKIKAVNLDEIPDISRLIEKWVQSSFNSSIFYKPASLLI